MKKTESFKLLFVYNANAGVANSLLDSAHKIFSPSTYNCNLCDITFGVFTENKAWKAFREQTDLELEFLHKDEFAQKFPSEYKKTSLPVVLKQSNKKLEIFLPSEQLNYLQSAEELIDAIRKRKFVK